MSEGIPGLRGGDHIGITVPDMEQAHVFFTEVLGCVHVYSLPEMRHDDDFPGGKAYEQDAPVKLWHPGRPAR